MPAAGPSRPKVIVIGAGLAGLAAAYRLSGEGWEVEVLEREERPGGRCATVSEAGFLFDTGAQYFRDSYDSALKTAIGLGMGERFRVPGERPGVYLDGEVNHFAPRSANPAGLLPWKALGRRAIIDFPVAALRLVARYRSYNLRFPEWWRDGDDRTAREFLGGRVSARFTADFAEPASLFALGAGLDDLSAAGMFVALRMLLADRTLSFTTGAGSLAAALAERLPVTTGAKVEEVLVRGAAATGVAYEKEGRRFEASADVVVSAVPAAEAVKCCGSIERTLGDLLERTSCSDAVVVNAGYRGSFDEPAGPVLLPDVEGFKAAWACTNRSKAYEYAPEGSSVLTVVFSGRGAGELLAEPDNKVLEKALSEAARLYPLAHNRRPSRWRVDRHPAGWPVVSPGYSERVRRLAREGSGVEGLLLAGDWTASPTMEGAVMSGFAAAERAVRTRDELH